MDSTRALYDNEVRFGVVMYGGVSLAIYINGVANELYELCCATPKLEPPAAPRAAPGAAAAAPGTREVYRKLSWLRGNPALAARYLAHARDKNANHDQALPDPFRGGDPAPGVERGERVRFVVDVIAGTSAGGINGVFLAKALANGEAFAPLKQLWINEGDINRLLNDKASWDGIAFAQTGAPPRSLLNSDRMYLKLLAAMQAMPAALAPLGQGESALSDELDLFVTTTDIRGSVVPLRLFDKVVYERRYKQVYHFQYEAAAGAVRVNDFAAPNIPFLAFASRCTSSFPFAFEPMQLLDAERLVHASLGGGGTSFAQWKPFFTGLSADDLAGDGWRQRAFGDGGYLDNKPFSYVANALSWRLAALPMERKLIYVEPAPSHPERERQVFADKPDAIQNAVAALTHIPQYETIREDLEAVLERNRRIERVEHIVRKVEADVEQLTEEPFARVMLGRDQAVPKWAELDLGDMVTYYGTSFLPYRRLRLTTVSDDLADRLAERWGVDRRSDRLYAIRALVRAWRERHYFEHRADKTALRCQSVNEYLNTFDLKYRLRRVGFLLRKTHQLVRLCKRQQRPEAERAPLSEADAVLWARLQRRQPELAQLQLPALLVALRVLRQQFAAGLAELRHAAWPSAAASGSALSGSELERQQFDQLLRMLIGEELAAPLRELPGEQRGEERSDKPATVRVELGEMAVAGARRTLQEAVYNNATRLFDAALAGGRTRLQQLLEQDINALGAAFRGVTGQPGAAARPAARGLLAKELLGCPVLRSVPAPTLEMPERRKIVTEVQPLASADIALNAALNSAEGRALRCFLAEYYLRFDEFDQASFPLYYDTGTGEPSTVEVIRVSPEDATSLIDEAPGHGDTGDKADAGQAAGARQRRKLAGTVLFNFGGFLDERWRRNDIMWGRLDGCERLIGALLPAPEDGALRAALLEEAQRAVLREEMTQPYYAELVQRFTQALKEQGQGTLKDDFKALLTSLSASDAQGHTRTALALQAVLGDDGVLDFVRHHYEVRRELDTEASLKTSARAITITGQMLEQIEKKQREGHARTVWVARAGRVFQLLLAASTPGGLSRRLLLHWLVRLYLFELLVLVGGALLSSPEVRNFAIVTFGLTLSLHAAIMILGDAMRGRWRWVRVSAVVLALAVGGLAALGALRVNAVGLKGALFGEAAAAAPAATAISQTAVSGRESS